MYEPKTIVFTKDDEINGVPMKKGTEIKVSYVIAEEKLKAKVAEEKKPKKSEDK